MFVATHFLKSLSWVIFANEILDNLIENLSDIFIYLAQDYILRKKSNDMLILITIRSTNNLRSNKHYK
jgi:hypothetical protein